MSQFELTPIEPAVKSARQVLEIVHDDFLRLPSITDEEALRIANPHDKARVTEVLGNLQDGPGEYFSIDRNHTWLGVIKLADWLYGDEAPFVPRSKTIVTKALHDLGVRDTETAGLHVLARSNETTDDEYEAITAQMLELAIEHAKKRGRVTLKCAVDEEDIALRAALFTEDRYRHVLPVTRTGMVDIRGVKRQSTLYEIALD